MAKNEQHDLLEKINFIINLENANIWQQCKYHHNFRDIINKNRARLDNWSVPYL